MDLSNLTLGNFAEALVFITGLLGSIAYLKANIHKWVLGDIDKKLEAIQMESCKDYLVQNIGNMERGVKLSQTEIQRFYDRYKIYGDLGGNGYIRSEVEALEEKGILSTIR